MQIQKKIFENNKAKGFWDKPRETGTLLMLVVTELSEALEADRKGLNARLDIFGQYYKEDLSPYQYTELFDETIKDTFEDEIADAIIRLLDICGANNIDIERHINLKLAYNKIRKRMHGKAY